MATTQYIGSRYVPLMADPIEWSSAKEYEPLTIVSHEGNSYTSRQYVPVGVAIDNEQYWALTGNYNAQVEQYRRETAQLGNELRTEMQQTVEAIEETVQDINLLQNEINLISPYLQGTAVYIEHEGKKILLDCGDTTDNDRMRAFLLAQQANALDCVVITHFDHDHYGAFAAVAPFCTSDTDILIQMEPPAGTENYDTYAAGLAYINQYVTQHGLKAPRTPYEGEHIVYDEIDLELHNTTLANRALYESTPGEGYAYNSGRHGLNNYSLISIVDINDYVITYSGDIEGVAQRLNTPYMRKSALSFTPHHISNIAGYLPWWTAQSPQQWLGTSAASTFGTNLYVNNRYLIKLIRYNYISDVILTHNRPLVINIYNNAYNIIEGESLIASIAEEGLDSCYTVLYQILPPNYINDNPFALYSMSLAELCSVCASSIYGLFTASTTLTGRSDMQIFRDIKTLLYESSVIDGASFSISTGRFLEVTVQSSDTLYNRLMVYGNVNPQEHTGYRLIDTGKQTKVVFPSAITTGANVSSYMTSAEFAKLVRSKRAYVVTSGGLTIHLSREESPTVATPRMGAANLTGYAFNTAMNNINRVQIANDGTLTAKVRTLTDSTLNDIQIAAVGVM